MGMSVPYTRMDDWNGWIENPSTENGFWYMRYFQQVGIPEREIEKNLKEGLHRFYSTLCAESSGAWINQVNHPKEASILDIMAPANQKLSWLSEGELNYYVNFFKEEGLRGPINWYRAIPLNGSDTMELSAKKISQPAAFISGAKDDVLKYGGLNNEWVDAMDAWFSDLKFKTLIEDAGHWLQCEKPEETTREILKFLEMVGYRAIRSRACFSWTFTSDFCFCMNIVTSATLKPNFLIYERLKTIPSSIDQSQSSNLTLYSDPLNGIFMS